MMTSAEVRPASPPSCADSTDTLKPRWSAHFRYMRSNISAQSWASVPPSPDCSVTTTSRSSYSPDSSERSSSPSNSLLTAARMLTISPSTESSSISWPNSCSVAASSMRSASFSKVSRSSATADNSPVTLRASSGSSQSPGAAAASSSSGLRSRS